MSLMRKLTFSLVLILIHALWIESKEDRIVFHDVGLGDAISIHIDSETILIDGGKGTELSMLLSQEVNNLYSQDVIAVLTHAHADHQEGLDAHLARNNRVPAYCGVDCQAKCEHSLSKSDGVVSYKLSSQEDFMILASYASEHCSASNVDPNKNSVWLLLSYDGTNHLFLGDLYIEQETQVVKDLHELGIYKVHTLKAGHHCSKTSTGEYLLDKLKPELVVCTAGSENRYGHPHREVLDRLEKRQIDFRTTGRDGTVSVFL